MDYDRRHKVNFNKIQFTPKKSLRHKRNKLWSYLGTQIIFQWLRVWNGSFVLSDWKQTFLLMFPNTHCWILSVFEKNIFNFCLYLLFYIVGKQTRPQIKSHIYHVKCELSHFFFASLSHYLDTTGQGAWSSKLLNQGSTHENDIHIATFYYLFYFIRKYLVPFKTIAFTSLTVF